MTMKPGTILMRRFSILAVTLAVAIGASRGLTRAESGPACKSGDCCSLCPRTSEEGDEQALKKSSNGVTLDPKLFVGQVRQAYIVAEKNPLLLAQLDCYCGCYK